MRPPRLGRMNIDKADTAKIRAARAGDTTVQVTINIDAETLREPQANLPVDQRALSEPARSAYERKRQRPWKHGVAPRLTGREFKRMRRILVA